MTSYGKLRQGVDMNQGRHKLRPTLHAMRTMTLAMIVVAVATFIAGVLAGIYAIATALAIAMAGNFNFAESTRHANTIAFESAVKRATHAKQVAGAICELADSVNRRQCHAASVIEQRRANRAASVDSKTPTLTSIPITLRAGAI